MYNAEDLNFQTFPMRSTYHLIQLFASDVLTIS